MPVKVKFSWQLSAFYCYYLFTEGIWFSISRSIGLLAILWPIKSEYDIRLVASTRCCTTIDSWQYKCRSVTSLIELLQIISREECRREGNVMERQGNYKRCESGRQILCLNCARLITVVLTR